MAARVEVRAEGAKVEEESAAARVVAMRARRGLWKRRATSAAARARARGQLRGQRRLRRGCRRRPSCLRRLGLGFGAGLANPDLNPSPNPNPNPNQRHLLSEARRELHERERLVAALTEQVRPRLAAVRVRVRVRARVRVRVRVNQGTRV